MPFCIGLITCGISVSICIRDCASVLVVQGNWKSLCVELSLMLLLLNIGRI